MNLSRADALGQLLMAELADDHWTSTLERFLRLVNPGGILLSARHLRTRESTAELLRKIALALPVPPFLALEEEGGAIDPLQALFPPLPSPRAAARKGVSAAARLGELAGAGLKLLGFNTNLAPLLDVPTPSPEARDITRAFSTDAREVARCGEAFSRGLERHKVLPCAKFFPGLDGSKTRGDSELPLVGKTMAELWHEDLIPYRQLLPRLPLVIVGHGAYKAYDFDYSRPAVLSENIVEGLLRVKLAYRGVAVADDLDTEGIRRMVEVGEAAVRSVRAGCDLLLVGCGLKSIEKTLAGLKKGVDSGKLQTRRVEQALARLRWVKKSLAPPSGKISKSACHQLTRQLEDFSKECRPLEQKIA